MASRMDLTPTTDTSTTPPTIIPNGCTDTSNPSCTDELTGVESLVRFEEKDLFDTDIRDATVVTLYLLPSVNMKLRPKLWRELKPGTRVVSHTFDMEDWKPEKVEEVGGSEMFLWVIKER